MMPLGVAFSGPPSWLTHPTNREWSSGVHRKRGLAACAAAAAAAWALLPAET